LEQLSFARIFSLVEHADRLTLGSTFFCKIAGTLFNWVGQLAKCRCKKSDHRQTLPIIPSRWQSCFKP